MRKPPLPPTVDELLTALATSRGGRTAPPGAIGVAEIVARGAGNPETVRRQLRALAAAGRLEVLRVLKKCLDGRIMPHVVYRLNKRASR